MREELIKYLTKLVDVQEQIYGLKGDNSDLVLFCDLLRVDNFTRIENNFKHCGESVLNLIPNKK